MQSDDVGSAGIPIISLHDDNVGSAGVPVIPIESVLPRYVLVRDIDTAQITQEVFKNGMLLSLAELPEFNHNDDNDPNWYRLKEANDGDCLYWCILQVLEDNKLHRDIINTADLRMFLIHVLQTEPENVYTQYDVNDDDDAATLQFIVNEKTEQLEIGIKEPSNFEGWGREEDMPIITWAFNLNIYVYNQLYGQWLTSYNHNHNNPETINVFLEYTGSHFNILLPKSDIFQDITPLDDDYFRIVEKAELIPEVKLFVEFTSIQSVRAAWNFFKKYNFRNCADAFQFYSLPESEKIQMWRYMQSHNLSDFQSGGNYRKRTSKKRKLQRRKSRRNL
jgi:hypothetical protein